MKVVAKQSMFPSEGSLASRAIAALLPRRALEINAGVSAWVRGPAYAQVPGAGLATNGGLARFMLRILQEPYPER
jgi:hypothetical protein